MKNIIFTNMNKIENLLTKANFPSEPDIINFIEIGGIITYGKRHRCTVYIDDVINYDDDVDLEQDDCTEGRFSQTHTVLEVDDTTKEIYAGQFELHDSSDFAAHSDIYRSHIPMEYIGSIAQI